MFLQFRKRNVLYDLQTHSKKKGLNIPKALLMNELQTKNYAQILFSKQFEHIHQKTGLFGKLANTKWSKEIIHYELFAQHLSYFLMLIASAKPHFLPLNM